MSINPLSAWGIVIFIGKSGQNLKENFGNFRMVFKWILNP
jgi:hypothetical protein